MDLMKEYTFVEVRDEGKCTDTLVIVFNCFKTDTLFRTRDEIIELYGVYKRKIYYENKLLFTQIDTVIYIYGSHRITFYRFSYGCICKSDRRYVLAEIEFFGHPAEQSGFPLDYSLFGFPERKLRGIFGGCHGEHSYYRLVGVKSLVSVR